MQAAHEGKRTLLVEMDAKGSIGSVFGVPDVGYDPVHVAPNLSVMTMQTEQSLREYLRIHLRIPLVTKIGPLASTFDFVADAAPGVREVLAVGKVCWEARERHYDVVIVDAEASGHVVAQLESPRVIRDLVRVGMVRDQVQWMLDLLGDARRTGLVVVTTPQAMSLRARLITRSRKPSLGLTAPEAMIAACYASDDYREGARAFMEKRPPRFRGV